MTDGFHDTQLQYRLRVLPGHARLPPANSPFVPVFGVERAPALGLARSSRLPRARPWRPRGSPTCRPILWLIFHPLSELFRSANVLKALLPSALPFFPLWARFGVTIFEVAPAQLELSTLPVTGTRRRRSDRGPRCGFRHLVEGKVLWFLVLESRAAARGAVRGSGSRDVWNEVF